MKVSIIGAGYVGLVTGVCLAEKGHQIVCVDVDQEKVEKINAAVSPIYEEGLPELLKRNAGQRLTATSDCRVAVLSTDITFITVGTPCKGDEIDLTYLKEASRQVGEALAEKSTYHVVVVKSTVVPGTTECVVRPILETASQKRAGRDFGVGTNPEFLTEGHAIQDFMQPDRIVIGGIDQRSTNLIERLYDGFVGIPRLRTTNKTAEMIKYASNCLLATLISFSNEMANLCSVIGGIDIIDVLHGVHLSNYLTVRLNDGMMHPAPITAFVQAGCGYGGSCLPKDVKAMISYGRQRGSPMLLLEAVNSINERQPAKVISLLEKHFSSLRGIRIGILGLSFRPETNDLRESPAIPIIQALLPAGASVKAYDPVSISEARKIFSDNQIQFCNQLSEVIEGVDALVLVTRWKEFVKVPQLISKLDNPPLVIDGRRMWDKNDFTHYDGIGL
jgi:UDPglucose 6-dehydrogenase/GDP-mannose 6-dehydrogenase